MGRIKINSIVQSEEKREQFILDSKGSGIALPDLAVWCTPR